MVETPRLQGEGSLIFDYLFILSRGKIVYQSTSSELSQKPEVQLAYLGVSQSETKEMKPSE